MKNLVGSVVVVNGPTPPLLPSSSSSNKVMSLRKPEVEAQTAKLSVQAQPPPSPQEEDALLRDLEQLEGLPAEAERMKALGNKHMAAQEHTLAYNAYSAALQLSPAGPSSHVFLTNRAASLLSLKRYAAAETDAKLAVSLAPTFGKAHARLGQAKYLLRDYQGAIESHKTAMELEPGHRGIHTYLEKAETKLKRRLAREAARNEEERSLQRTEEGNTVAEDTIVNSIATDPHSSSAVALEEVEVIRKQASPMGATAAAANKLSLEQGDEDDPDFYSALLIQERAKQLLALNRYKRAIEAYSAALFLVPDDPFLSPELHLGRAHALNGLRRQESVQNNALLSPKGNRYSALAKSLFYKKDYAGSIDAFDCCQSLLPEGESLSASDEMYLQQAKQALQEGNDKFAIKSTSSSIPKVKPPRFAPREQAIQSTQNMPPIRRHESAHNDASLALIWNRYSTLAKSLFYRKDYSGAIDAFGCCRSLLPEGESLSMCDETYLQQAKHALQEDNDENAIKSTSSSIPNSPPPRVVPREQSISSTKAIQSTRTMPPTPTKWPLQSPRAPTPGVERKVTFLSESLGLELNRGTDGIVRVTSISSETFKKGEIYAGDVVCEAAGVDIRRPITNTMWGDIAAFIKLAPRPIEFVVTSDMPEHPASIIGEMDCCFCVSTFLFDLCCSFRR